MIINQSYKNLMCNYCFLPSNCRYLENGVWDLVAVQNKPIMTKFACCETPIYEVQYRLIFKRRPDFYIKYLIIPVFILSTLSTLVFYLPSESGEKIQLSITNLLALVVFQQVISENMPPSGSESPIIGMCELVLWSSKYSHSVCRCIVCVGGGESVRMEGVGCVGDVRLLGWGVCGCVGCV